MNNLTVSILMTKEPITVRPSDKVTQAAKILSERNFNGLPVVNEENKLVGIITEFDLISRGSDLHLPTLINVLQNVGIYKQDSSALKDDLKKLLSLQVADIMNTEPLSINVNSSVQDLASLFASHHRVNPIPVVDGENKLVGIVSRFDLVRLFVDEGNPTVHPEQTTEISDQKVDSFIGDFERRFVFVSRTRVRLWPIISVAFALVGFVIAFAIIIRIATK